jgi:Recombinase
VVRRIFAARAAGTTIRHICRQLNAGAVPTPTGRRAVWGTSTINRLLRNEAYIGRVYYNRTEIVWPLVLMLPKLSLVGNLPAGQAGDGAADDHPLALPRAPEDGEAVGAGCL